MPTAVVAACLAAWAGWTCKRRKPFDCPVALVTRRRDSKKSPRRETAGGISFCGS